ncbi:MAG TPA: hypothetical protein DIT64_10025 [Verrucomicrobiales bacterium]|nr:hypothetical protein [Verrucomicrobiales bacterium]
MNTRKLPDLADFRSLLVVKPSSLGDIVHTLPAVHAIKSAHPHLHVRWLANTEWNPLLEGSPVVDEVVPFPRKSFRGLLGGMRFLNWISAQWRRRPHPEPEIVLDFQGLLRSGLVARLSGSRPVVGLSDSREGARFFHDHVIAVNAGAHALERYLEVPSAFGIPLEKPRTPLPEGTMPAGWPEREDAVVVHPWSRGKGKSLEPAVLEALCAALAPSPVVLVGVRNGVSVPRGEHITDLSARTTLPELVWLLRRARGVVSVDSGPMHIAAAVNDRTLGIHTWSDPRQVGPHNPRAWVWKDGRIAHRCDFASAECASTRSPNTEDARALAEFVKKLAS